VLLGRVIRVRADAGLRGDVAERVVGDRARVRTGDAGQAMQVVVAKAFGEAQGDVLALREIADCFARCARLARRQSSGNRATVGFPRSPAGSGRALPLHQPRS
jgi:hypothetical protein